MIEPWADSNCRLPQGSFPLPIQRVFPSYLAREIRFHYATRGPEEISEIGICTGATWCLPLPIHDRGGHP